MGVAFDCELTAFPNITQNSTAVKYRAHKKYRLWMLGDRPDFGELAGLLALTARGRGFGGESLMWRDSGGGVFAVKISQQQNENIP